MAAARKLKSVLLVVPATMLQHWLSELRIWAPGLRRILVHPSGETDGLSRTVSSQLLRLLAAWLKKARADRVNEPIDDDDWDTLPWHSFCGTGYAVVTTYENLRRNPEVWIAHPWTFLVLDEAQKIRNPDADITVTCKRIRTPHRLAMSGTPIQNDLRELWSLVDFVFPGRLGTLPTFEQEFAEPIKRGGYANASPMQVQLAYRCSLVLKDLIGPLLLRRQKKDVKEVQRMPGKTEHVLFCRLSARQRALYEAFLRSDLVSKVVRGSSALFAAITVLRKICNHTDLVCDPDKASFESFLANGFINVSELDDSSDSDSEVDDDGESLAERSGKLEVLSRILPLWHKQGHRVLIFCQWRKMLTIIQHFTQAQGWKFGRLDGNTNVKNRQRLVDDFNADKSYFGMLCTTRTGGVGLNLTGVRQSILLKQRRSWR
jgi:DNA excision repair protein ERCC-6